MAKPSSFTQKKFLSLPKEQQHKKCAELLKQVYNDERELAEYQLWMKWYGSTTHLTTKKEMSDRYHWHLKLSNVQFKEHNLLPEIRTGDKEKPIAKTFPITIYLDNIRSAHNVGSILRTIEAFSLGKIYFSASTPPIDHPQVIKTSMKASEWVTTEKQIDSNKPIIALETSPDAHSIFEFEFPESFTLILGNEEYGCSDEMLKKADHLIEIPLRGRKNSLNVANAFAIAAAEIVRQRTNRK